MVRGWDQADIGAQAGGDFDGFNDLGGKDFHAANGVAQGFGCHFDLDFHFVEIAFAGEDDLVVRQRGFNLKECCLNLGGEDVDAADNKPCRQNGGQCV